MWEDNVMCQEYDTNLNVNLLSLSYVINEVVLSTGSDIMQSLLDLFRR